MINKTDLELVSIITPTYNCRDFITETIESVLAQTYGNWEMIIIDDCSSDTTKEIVQTYADKDRRIKYHRLDKKSGAAVARNTALRMAKGKWIAFLDSDDLWNKDKLEKQVFFMMENDYPFSYTKYEEIDDLGVNKGVVVSGPSKISRLGMLCFCWPGCLTVMYNRDVVGLIQIPDIAKNNDYAMWLYVSKKADCYLLPDVLAKYRKRQGSISNHSKFSLIKWHYKLFRIIERNNSIGSIILTLNNLIWGCLKKILYIQHHS